MATIQQIEKALKNAIAAGAMDDARQLQAALNAAKQDASNQIPGADVSGSLAPAPRPSLGQRIKGAGETALTFGTGIPSSIGGGLAGLAAVPVEVAQKLSGSQNPVDAEKVAQNVTQAFTYAPRTETGREYVQDIASNLEGLQALPGIQGELGAVANVAKMGTPYVAGVTRPLTAPVAAVGQKAGQAVSNAYQTVKGAVTGAPKKESFGPGSIGAAQTPQAIQRQATAEALGFQGEAGLTKGMLTRDHDIQNFENETAKLPVGAPIRERQENITKQILRNFDDLIDQPGPVNVSERAIGQSVDQVLVNKANLAKAQYEAEYGKARNAGELAEPVPTNTLVQVLNESTSAEGTAPILSAARRELIRLGGATVDENGNLIPKKLPVNDLEELRKFVNSATKQEGPDLKYSGDLRKAIDSATEAAGGDFYKKARKLRADYAREFENTAITEQLLSLKRGTSQRQVAFEDVFKKVILDSPVEEINKLRKTLLTAGPEGKQAWADMKSKFVDYISKQSENSGLTEGGNPILSAKKMNDLVKEFDRAGKLDSLLGKRNAQKVRDLAEIVTLVKTNPPGSVNTSGTGAQLTRLVLDSAASGLTTGVPLPLVTVLKHATMYVKDAKTRTRIRQTLNGLKVEGEK